MLRDLLKSLQDMVEDVELLGEDGFEAMDTLLDGLLQTMEDASRKHKDLGIYKDTVEEFVKRIEEE